MEKYERGRKIGQGSFGKIYLVNNRVTKAQYVMKEVELSLDDNAARAQAIAEAKFLKALHHPNIISVVEYFIEDDVLYMIMEYAEGLLFFLYSVLLHTRELNTRYICS